jgi:hypothetical protein
MAGIQQQSPAPSPLATHVCGTSSPHMPNLTLHTPYLLTPCTACVLLQEAEADSRPLTPIHMSRPHPCTDCVLLQTNEATTVGALAPSHLHRLCAE